MHRRVVVMVMCLAMIAGGIFAAEPGKGDDAGSGTGVLGVRAHGGPDAFGYEYWDSAEPGGPPFNFVDISGTGTALGLIDDGEANIAIGFSFPFYGVSYTDLRVGNNGGVILATSGNLWAGNTCPLPYTSADGPLILPFWDDIDSDTGDVYYQTFATCPNAWAGSGQCLVVQWNGRPHFSNFGDATFELILYDNGHILFQYQDVVFGDASYDNGASASVGIQDYAQNSAYVLEYSCDAANISDGMAIYWSADGLPVQPTPQATPVPGIPTLDRAGTFVLLVLLTGVALLLLRRRP